MSAKSHSRLSKRPIAWEWNIPLLLKSLVAVTVLVAIATFVYFWQSSSMAAELLAQAESSGERGENREKVKWLARYVRLVPADVEGVANLAFAVDLQESGPKQDIEFARSRLAAALVACGDNPEFEELATRLRRRLIPRELQFGAEKAPDVEKQILLLAAEKDDVDVIKWLAESLLMQRTVLEYEARKPSTYDGESDYWKWLASQPTGRVLQKAVDANPNDVELAQKLLFVCYQRPDWFNVPEWINTDKFFTKEQITELSSRTLERLSLMKENGRAQFVVYSYTAPSNREKANSILAEAVESAIDRLSKFAELKPNGDDTSSQKGSEEGSRSEEVGSLPADYEPSWDWQIALERARSVSGADAGLIYQRLVKLAAEKIPAQLREEAFLRLAVLKLEKSQNAEAIEICKLGLSSVADSSALNRVIALANLKLEKLGEASVAIKEIESNTETRLRQLDGVVGQGMIASEKAAARQQIAFEQWFASVLKGQVAIAEQDFVKAAKLLKESYRTTISIPPESRAEAGILLASCYAQTEQWDLVAQIYDECSVLVPKDRAISLAAAQAWRRVGSSERANDQLTGLDDKTFAGALEGALVIASKPGNQDTRAALAAIKTARERFDALSVEERATLEPWKLELLELRFESVNNKEPTVTLDKLETIAERYADVVEVQSQAALDFAAFGRMESSNSAIQRLERIAERTKTLNDRASLVLAKVSVLLSRKDSEDPEGALQLLASATKSLPEQALKFAKAAARIEMRLNRPEKAYDVLSSVPDVNVDFESVVLLAGIVDGLTSARNARADELSAKLDSWISRIEQVEGEDGTNWRYLAAERLIKKIPGSPNAVQLLENASRYYKEIEAIRPRWGLASALGAKIASIKAQAERATKREDRRHSDKLSEEAVTLWRRAIRDGDTRVSTVLDLVRELYVFVPPRANEAEAEFQRVSGLADSIVPISALSISFDVERGKFSDALDQAEKFTNAWPKEVGGWLVRAQTCFAASRAKGLSEKEKLELWDNSWNCLEEAYKLPMGKSMPVWLARFRFKFLTGDTVGATAILEQMMKEPSLPEEVRLYEAGLRYKDLKEYGIARKCFENCLLLNSPRTADVHLALADLNNLIGDTEESLNSLRKAHQAAPKNQAIRDRLAISLAFLKNEKADSFSWKEIDTLLSSSTQPATPSSTIVGAFIALSRGDEDRKAIAIRTLRELSKSSARERNEAKGLLARYFAVQWSKDLKKSRIESAKGNSASARKSLESAMANFGSARQLFEELLVEANPGDVARYVSLMLSFDSYAKEAKQEGGEDYIAIATRALSKLESTTGSSIASLQLRIRLAEARGEQATIGSIIAKWVEGAGDLESLGVQALWEIAGQTVLELGYAEESIPWLEKAYEKDPKKFGLLALALAREKKFDRAIDLCIKGYQSEPSPGAATMLAEIALLQTELKLNDDASQVLKEASVKFADSAELLDALGTIQLVQRRLMEAVSLYEMAEKREPRRLRTLNNLAMALSAVPMRKQEAIAKIEKAIEIYGRDPDLLDTLGQVQFRNGRLQEGLEALNEACELKDDVTFRIHLAQVLMAMKNIAGAKEQWAKIKQYKLDGVVLMPEDKEFRKLLESQFSENLQ